MVRWTVFRENATFVTSGWPLGRRTCLISRGLSVIKPVCKANYNQFYHLMQTAWLGFTKYVNHPWNNLNFAIHHSTFLKLVFCIRHLCWAVLGLCIFQVQITKGKGTFISLASEKIPRSVEKAKQTKLGQDQLFKFWTNDNNKFHELTKDKTFVLGSQVNFIKINWPIQLIWLKEPVNYNSGDIGFFDTLLTAYNNHWVLRTSPEDWWMTIR